MKYFLILFSFISVFSATAQTIEFNSSVVPDTTVYMARYFGSKLYYADTAECVGGKFVFNAAKHHAGLYAIILPDKTRFDFIIDGGEDVKMEIKDTKKLIATTKVVKSENNKIFFEYMRFMTSQRKKGQGLADQMKDSTITKKEKDKYIQELKAVNEEVLSYQKKLVSENPKKFVGVMIGITLDTELPPHPRDKDGNITDSNFVYRYYIEHYWDNVDLKDPRVVNTPVFHNKLDKYFSTKGVLHIPDTVSLYASKLIDMTDQEDQSNRVFQYIVHHITNKYETSQIMGMDKVFCYMARNYYCPPNNKAYWMVDSNTTKVCERAEKVCRIAIGSPSVPLILPDSTEEKWYGTYDIDAKYTILYFWDPNCGHCKKVTPKLQTLYDKKFKERDVEIYAVAKATGEEFEQWKKFIRDNELSFINVGLTDSIYKQAKKDPSDLLRTKTTLQSLNYSDTYDIYSTPRIFILDENKEIIYKQLSIGQLEEIIDKLTGHDDDEKLFPLEDPENGDNPPDH